MGDKFAMIIRQGKLTISFCKKLFNGINYPPEKSRKLGFSNVFQEVQKETIAMKWVKYVLNKYVSRMLIFMLVPDNQSALVLLKRYKISMFSN